MAANLEVGLYLTLVTFELKVIDIYRKEQDIWQSVIGRLYQITASYLTIAQLCID